MSSFLGAKVGVNSTAPAMAAAAGAYVLAPPHSEMMRATPSPSTPGAGSSLLAKRLTSSSSSSLMMMPPPPPAANPLLPRYERALNLDHFVKAVSAIQPEPLSPDSSDCEESMLDAIECEAKCGPINKAHSNAFDRQPAITRGFEPDLALSGDDEKEMTEEECAKKSLELLRMHLKRKRFRKKMRTAADNEIVFMNENPEEDSIATSNVKADVIKDASVSFDSPQSAMKNRHPPNSLLNPLLKIKADESKVKHKRHRKKKGSKHSSGRSSSAAGKTSPEYLAELRRLHWISIAKKEIPRAHKARNLAVKEKIALSKKTAQACARQVKQRALASQKATKELQAIARKIAKEVMNYWKKQEKIIAAQKRKEEKEAEVQLKQDVQLLESRRQQRKLNFLITQTELYAHFMAKKIDNEDEGKEGEILGRLSKKPEGEREMKLLKDDYDVQQARILARNNAAQAIEKQERSTSAFDQTTTQRDSSNAQQGNEERKQPTLFKGKLKNYQLKGMNWLMSLYDQGINGILADEMGLGKTVQALSMLSYIAENYHIWGPFLVVTPASTLFNWQQEIKKFVPDFKVIPYWGTPQERKILRQFWDQKNLHTPSASFHVVITSYQLIITDFKYFNRIKWQYLVLDEAQAIKSSASQRWKMLLSFKCRNRLLLSGTPIQNSMAELWSLLHFVMPTLFDSHAEFDDWFSKDIESSAQDKAQIDEKQISRLHMILKPFMLRRVKKDVENELSDKVEVLLYCPLTIRQKTLYSGLKKNINIEEILQGMGSQSSGNPKGSTTSLMNLVMQFRKVCNHPELFERRTARSPFFHTALDRYLMPKLIVDSLIYEQRRLIKSRGHLLENKLNVFHPENVHESYLEAGEFSYLRFVDHSPTEQYQLQLSLLERLISLMKKIQRLEKFYLDRLWQSQSQHQSSMLLIPTKLSPAEIERSATLSSLVFASHYSTVHTHSNIILHPMKETDAHRLIRTRHVKGLEMSDQELNQMLVPTLKSEQTRESMTLACQPCDMPRFLYDLSPKVASPGRLAYSHCRNHANRILNHSACSGGQDTLHYGSPQLAEAFHRRHFSLQTPNLGGLWGSRPTNGFSNIVIPDKQTLVSDSGKLHALDLLLTRLKSEGHRVLIYSQMTKMIDLLEEYLTHRRFTFIRLDGSSKLDDRRDMVEDFQTRSDIFVFLLSTRAGGLGINLTAADTVIFFDSDWNPTVDQQAMDRAHRLGQTKQVTVYRLVCKGTIEERILERAREKSEIQRVVIQGGSFKGGQSVNSATGKSELKPKEVVSLLLDDEELVGGKQLKRKADADEENSKRSKLDELFINVDAVSETSSRSSTRPSSPSEKQEPMRKRKSASKVKPSSSPHKANGPQPSTTPMMTVPPLVIKRNRGKSKTK